MEGISWKHHNNSGSSWHHQCNFHPLQGTMKAQTEVPIKELSTRMEAPWKKPRKHHGENARGGTTTAYCQGSPMDTRHGNTVEDTHGKTTHRRKYLRIRCCASPALPSRAFHRVSFFFRANPNQHFYAQVIKQACAVNAYDGTPDAATRPNG